MPMEGVVCVCVCAHIHTFLYMHVYVDAAVFGGCICVAMGGCTHVCAYVHGCM